MNQIELHNNQFLTDKEWWIEETDREFILFVKHNGKVYQTSIEKKPIEFSRKLDCMKVKEGITNILISEIKLKIWEDEADNLKTYMENKKKIWKQ